MIPVMHLDADVRGILESLPDLAGYGAAAPMLPAACYTSPEFFEFERRHVFTRSWICVGRQEQIPAPGDYLTPKIGDERRLSAPGTGHCDRTRVGRKGVSLSAAFLALRPGR